MKFMFVRVILIVFVLNSLGVDSIYSLAVSPQLEKERQHASYIFYAQKANRLFQQMVGGILESNDKDVILTKSLETVNNALKYCPKAPGMHMFKGRILSTMDKEKNRNNSLREYNLVIKYIDQGEEVLEGKDIVLQNVLKFRAELYKDAGLLKFAKKDFLRLLKMDFKNKSVLWQLGVVSKLLLDDTEAKKYFDMYENILKVEGAQEALYEFYSRVIYQFLESDIRFEYKNKSIEAFPTAKNYFERAVLYLSEEDKYLDEALEDLEKSRDLVLTLGDVTRKRIKNGHKKLLKKNDLIETVLNVVGSKKTVTKWKNVTHEKLEEVFHEKLKTYIQIDLLGEVYEKMSDIYLRKEDFEKAQDCIENAILASPLVSRNYYKNAIILGNINNNKAALELLEKLIVKKLLISEKNVTEYNKKCKIGLFTKSPNNPSVASLNIFHVKKLNDILEENSIEPSEFAAEISNNIDLQLLYDCYDFCSDLSLKMGNNEDAIEYLEKAITVMDTDVLDAVGAYRKYCELCLDLNEWDKGINKIKEYVEIYEDDKSLAGLLGYFYYKKGGYDTAYSILQRAYNLGERSYYLYMALGACYENKKFYSQARDLYRESKSFFALIFEKDAEDWQKWPKGLIRRNEKIENGLEWLVSSEKEFKKKYGEFNIKGGISKEDFNITREEILDKWRKTFHEAGYKECLVKYNEVQEKLNSENANSFAKQTLLRSIKGIDKKLETIYDKSVIEGLLKQKYNLIQELVQIYNRLFIDNKEDALIRQEVLGFLKQTYDNLLEVRVSIDKDLFLQLEEQGHIKTFNDKGVEFKWIDFDFIKLKKNLDKNQFLILKRTINLDLLYTVTKSISSICMELGRYNEILFWCDKGLKLSPANSEIFYLKALAYQKIKGKEQLSLDEITKGINSARVIPITKVLEYKDILIEQGIVESDLLNPEFVLLNIFDKSKILERLKDVNIKSDDLFKIIDTYVNDKKLLVEMYLFRMEFYNRDKKEDLLCDDMNLFVENNELFKVLENVLDESNKLFSEKVNTDILYIMAYINSNIEKNRREVAVCKEEEISSFVPMQVLNKILKGDFETEAEKNRFLQDSLKEINFYIRTITDSLSYILKSLILYKLDAKKNHNQSILLLDNAIRSALSLENSKDKLNIFIDVIVEMEKEKNITEVMLAELCAKEIEINKYLEDFLSKEGIVEFEDQDKKYEQQLGEARGFFGNLSSEIKEEQREDFLNKSANALTIALQCKPLSVDAIGLLARVYYEQKNHDMWRNLLNEKISKFSKKDVEHTKLLSTRYILEGDLLQEQDDLDGTLVKYKEAYKIVSKIQSENKDRLLEPIASKRTEILLELVEKYKVKGELEQSLGYMNQILDMIQTPQVFYQRSLIYWKMEKENKAFEDINKAIKIAEGLDYNPVLVLTLYNQKAYFYAHAQKKNYAKAIEFYKKSKEIDPQNYEVFLMLALCYLEVEEKENFLDCTDKIIEEDKNKSNIAMAYKHRANFFFSNKEYDKALENINEAIILDSTDPEKYSIRIDVFIEQKKYASALASVVLLLQNSVDEIYNGYVKIKKAFLHYKLNDFDAALDEAIFALSSGVADSMLWETLGACYEYKKDYASALESYYNGKVLNTFVKKSKFKDLKDIPDGIVKDIGKYFQWQVLTEKDLLDKFPLDALSVNKKKKNKNKNNNQNQKKIQVLDLWKKSFVNSEYSTFFEKCNKVKDLWIKSILTKSCVELEDIIEVKPCEPYIPVFAEKNGENYWYYGRKLEKNKGLLQTLPVFYDEELLEPQMNNVINKVLKSFSENVQKFEELRDLDSYSFIDGCYIEIRENMSVLFNIKKYEESEHISMQINKCLIDNANKQELMNVSQFLLLDFILRDKKMGRVAQLKESIAWYKKFFPEDEDLNKLILGFDFLYKDDYLKEVDGLKFTDILVVHEDEDFNRVVNAYVNAGKCA